LPAHNDGPLRYHARFPPIPFTLIVVRHGTDSGYRPARPVGLRRGADVEEQRMIVVNTETIAGYTIKEVKGLVQGNTIRAKHLGRDMAAGFKNLVGGELVGYTELLVEARRQAMERMLAQAEQLNANAVVNVRFTTSAITQGAAELYAYGTAVVVEEAS